MLSFYLNQKFYSRLSGCFTARGSSAGFSQASPTKVEAHKSFILTESSLVYKKEHLLDY